MKIKKLENVLSKVIGLFRLRRWSWVCDRMHVFYIVPVPLFVSGREGLYIGFLFLLWDFGFSYCPKEK